MPIIKTISSLLYGIYTLFSEIIIFVLYVNDIYLHWCTISLFSLIYLFFLSKMKDVFIKTLLAVFYLKKINKLSAAVRETSLNKFIIFNKNNHG